MVGLDTAHVRRLFAHQNVHQLRQRQLELRRRLQMTIITTDQLNTPPPPQPFYGPFSGTTRVSQCQQRTSGLYGAGKINRGRHTDHLSGWAPLHPD